MKIITYNPNGSIKEVRRRHFQVPEYITSFDPQCSFLNIKEEDICIVSSKDDSIEKDLLLNKYRFLIKYDYNNYSLYSYLEKGLTDSDLDNFNKILSFIVHPNRIEANHYCHNTRFNLLWVYTILFHAIKVKNRTTFIDPDKREFINVINYIHRLYHCLRKNDIEERFMEGIKQKLTYTIYPFTNIQTKNYQYSNIFDDDDVLVKVMEALYHTDGKCRETIYALAHGIDFLLQGKLPKGKNNPYKLVSMISNKSMPNANEITLMKATPSNGIETTEIKLPPMELVYLMQDSSVDDSILSLMAKYLNDEYNIYIQSKGSEIQSSVENLITIMNSVSTPTILTPKRWQSFYYQSLQDLINEFKRHYSEARQIQCPYYYYFLLTEKCKPCTKYEFTGTFLMDLTRNNEKCTMRPTLYEQMAKLNFIEEQAGWIRKEEKDDNISENKKEMLALRDELLEGTQRDIANAILERYNDNITNSESRVERIMVFLEPLFNKEYVESMSVKSFRLLLEYVFKEETISNELGMNSYHQPFNFKLVLNILGFLSKSNKHYNSKIKNPPLRKGLGSDLLEDLTDLWNLEGTSNYRKSVEQFDKKIDNRFANNPFTVLTISIKRDIENAWDSFQKRQNQYINESE